MKHANSGFYSTNGNAYVMDDFGNLIYMSDDMFDAAIYFRCSIF